MTQATAGLIYKGHHGPDMPMDARIIRRLPWSVMRRVIGPSESEQGTQAALNALAEYDRNDGLLDIRNGRWKLAEWINASLGLYHFVTGENKSGECEDCDGDGYHSIGRHEYECKECEGEGKVQSDGEEILRQAYVTYDGRILGTQLYDFN